MIFKTNFVLLSPFPHLLTHSEKNNKTNEIILQNQLVKERKMGHHIHDITVLLLRSLLVLDDQSLVYTTRQGVWNYPCIGGRTYDFYFYTCVWCVSLEFFSSFSLKRKGSDICENFSLLMCEC